MSSRMMRCRAVRIAAAWALVAVAGCGGHNHLSEYDFASRSLALVYIAPPRPVLLTGWYDVDTQNAVIAVVAAGSDVAKEVSGRRARVRLDSATSLTDVASLMSVRTLDRTSRYLAATAVNNSRNADFVLEVNMRSSGIDVRGQNAAYLFMSATAVLLDAHTGREIWSYDVDGRHRLTPFLYGDDRLPTGVITAGVLNSVSVADYQRALEQLSDFSANEISDGLREALRDARDQKRGD